MEHLAQGVAVLPGEHVTEADLRTAISSALERLGTQQSG
jgi:hypothetical protein